MNVAKIRSAAPGILADAAIIWGIVSLLIVAIVGGAHLVLAARFQTMRVFDHYSRLTSFQKSAYGDWRPAALNDMLTWTWSPGWVYEPRLGFREKPRASEFVNVSADGVRLTEKGARGLADFTPESLFVFGGSTTFGYGVADADTIASHLQSILGERTRVFNLGRAYYYSAQENDFFESLLRAGFKPSVALFVDGLNERCEIDVYQRELGVFFARAQGQYDWRAADAIQPIVYAARKAGKLLGAKEGGNRGVDLHRLGCVRYGQSVPLKDVVRENLEYRARLCAAYQVRCVTFLQPIAGIHGKHPDLSQHSQEARRLLRAKTDHLAATYKAKGVMDVTGALDNIERPAYVDGLHYSSEAGRAIAARIAVALGAS